MTQTIQSFIHKISQPRKLKLPVTLRKNRDELAYRHAMKSGKSRPLISEPRLMEWNLWALIANEFPYTAAYKTHHMLIPKRVVNEKGLSDNEISELRQILEQISSMYDCRIVNFKKRQSKQEHYHMHLLVFKDDRSQVGF